MATSGDVLEIVCNTKRNVIEFVFTWNIEHFSSYLSHQSGEAIFSSDFSTGTSDRNLWCLVMYPVGDREENKDFISIYLKLKNSDKKCVTAEAKFSLIDSCQQVRNEANSGCYKYLPGKPGYGYNRYMRRQDILFNSNRFLVDDKLTFKCQIRVFSDPVNESNHSEPLIQVVKSSLSEDLMQLLNSESCSDLTILVNKAEFKVHMAVLMHRSSVFRAMFESEMEEKQQKRVVITDLQPNVVQAMLRYIYSDQIPDFSTVSPEDLLTAADKYELIRLKSMCETELLARLTINNATQIWFLSDLHDCRQLKEHVLTFIHDNIEELIQKDHWNEMLLQKPTLAKEFLDKLISCKKTTSNKKQKK